MNSTQKKWPYRRKQRKKGGRETLKENGGKRKSEIRAGGKECNLVSTNRLERGRSSLIEKNDERGGKKKKKAFRRKRGKLVLQRDESEKKARGGQKTKRGAKAKYPQRTPVKERFINEKTLGKSERKESPSASIGLVHCKERSGGGRQCAQRQATPEVFNA